MIGLGLMCNIPDRSCLLGGVGMSTIFFGLSCSHYGHHALMVAMLFFLGQFTPNVGTPFFGWVCPPYTEGAGRNAVAVKHIPSAITVRVVIHRKSVDLSVGKDRLRRSYTRRGHCILELSDDFVHVHALTPFLQHQIRG